MHIVVVTLAPTLTINNKLSAYAPYVREMDLWFRHSDTVTIVCPTEYSKKLLTTSFERQDIEIIAIPFLIFNSFFRTLISLLKLPLLFCKIFIQMYKADHIHLRCPGNIGLIGCIVQICFPKKIKTAKYAGNWDPKAIQPLSYRFQKWILQNTFLTKNMKVLVYGLWPDQSKNVKPFFTASYWNKHKTSERPTFLGTYNIVFVGSLSSGKRPFYAVQFIEALIKSNIKVHLDIYGEGTERKKIEKYIVSNQLESYVTMRGNCNNEIIATAYKSSHFMILPSKSEGWPKVVAEAMWWGCIPLVTPISCVPWMLDYGKRGMLLDMNIKKDISSFITLIQDSKQLETISEKAQNWSQGFTLDHFETEIQNLLK